MGLVARMGEAELSSTIILGAADFLSPARVITPARRVTVIMNNSKIRALVVTAWQSASGWMNLWVPTAAVTIGGVALAKVGYDRYLRFVWPLLPILLVLVCGSWPWAR